MNELVAKTEDEGSGVPAPIAPPSGRQRLTALAVMVRDKADDAIVKAGAFKESVKDHLDIWREAVKADRLRPKLSPMGKAELAFLPAALEVSESPASPAARVTALIIAAFFTLALGWSSIGELDIVATAKGKIIPTERIKVIQPLETATVRAVTVREGQEVKAGDTLVVLEISGAASDVGRLTAENQAAMAEAARLAAQLEPDPVKAFRPPAELPKELVDMHRALLDSALAEHRAKVAALGSDLAKRQAELATIRTDLTRLSAVEAKIADETGRRRELADKGFGSQIDRLKVEKELAENQGNQMVQKAKLAEAAAAIESIKSQLNQVREEFRKDTTTRLSEARTKVQTTTQELAKAADRQRVQTLTAPVDGIAQQIEVNTIGGVVTPAQRLLTIVPKDSVLEVEAKMPIDKDIAFVEVGQHATVKVEAIPFTSHGTIDGRVEIISYDASRDEKDQEKEFTFPIRVSLSQNTIMVDRGKRIVLKPGMSVIVEVKTGTRKPIDYVLAPLRKYGAESWRER